MEIHVVFNYSAAGSIRHALKGRDAAVARFSDDLSRGPINPPQPALRRAWLDANLGYDNPDIIADEDAFWPKVLRKEVPRIAWVSRRSASEYCGFLEYLRRLGGLPTQIIDTTDEKDDNGENFRSTGSIPANNSLFNLLNGAHDVDASWRWKKLALWEKLRGEDSALRVVDRALTLKSVPLSFYDQQLLSLAGSDWQPMARVAGEFLTRETMDDLLVISRLYALIDAGLLSARETERPHPDVKLVRV